MRPDVQSEVSGVTILILWAGPGPANQQLLVTEFCENQQVFHTTQPERRKTGPATWALALTVTHGGGNVPGFAYNTWTPMNEPSQWYVKRFEGRASVDHFMVIHRY